VAFKKRQSRPAQSQAEEETKLRLVYAHGIGRMPISQLKKHLFEMHFQLRKIQNISYVGNEVEFLVDADYACSLTEQLKKAGITVHDAFDASAYRGPNANAETQQLAADRFAHRIARQMASTKPAVTDLFSKLVQETGQETPDLVI
jgi:hypothetical protein